MWGLGTRGGGWWQGPKILEWRNQEEAKGDGRNFDGQESGRKREGGDVLGTASYHGLKEPHSRGPLCLELKPLYDLAPQSLPQAAWLHMYGLPPARLLSEVPACSLPAFSGHGDSGQLLGRLATHPLLPQPTSPSSSPLPRLGLSQGLGPCQPGSLRRGQHRQRGAVSWKRALSRRNILFGLLRALRSCQEPE